MNRPLAGAILDGGADGPTAPSDDTATLGVVVRALVGLARGDGAAPVILVGGLRGGEGASTIAAQIAHVMASAFGARVCIVREASAAAATEIDVVSAAAPDAGARGAGVMTAHAPLRGLVGFERGALAGRIRALAPGAQVVIVDSPPLLVAAEAGAMAGEADGVIVVAESERTRIEDLDAAAVLLRRIGARLIGGVLNRRRRRLPGFLARLLGDPSGAGLDLAPPPGGDQP